MIKEYLDIGQIVGTHGVRGEMRVNPRCDGPEFIKQFKTLYFDKKGEKPVKVISSRVHGNLALVKLEGVYTVEGATALRNRVLYMKRSDAKIPAGSYFEAVFDSLVDNGLVRQPVVTKLYLKFRHYDAVTMIDKATGQKYKE